MKPSWERAPLWANYLAMDADGDWYWFENEPDIEVIYWSCVTGRYELSPTRGQSWRNSLELRPC